MRCRRGREQIHFSELICHIPHGIRVQNIGAYFKGMRRRNDGNFAGGDAAGVGLIIRDGDDILPPYVLGTEQRDTRNTHRIDPIREGGIIRPPQRGCGTGKDNSKACAPPRCAGVHYIDTGKNNGKGTAYVKVSVSGAEGSG